MKIALITTTINVPHVLKLYRKNAHPLYDIKFFVAGDEKTPLEAYEFCAAIDNCEIYSPERQRELGYACSELIGWNSIGRRNIMTLEALAWGADIIVTIDDDNAPFDYGYFRAFSTHLDDGGFMGVKASSKSKWFDVGQLFDPVAPHRGFPHTKKSEQMFHPITDARVGLAAGICMGDPDIDAATRIVNGPIVHRVSELLRAGIVTDPRETWTVFNSQNTGFLRELAPAFFMAPGLGRHDDIFASLIVQRVMRERKMHVHFGTPFVWQQRNEHDLIKDLSVEIFGMSQVVRLGDWLASMALPEGSVVEQVAAIMAAADSSGLSYGVLPQQTVEAFDAWLHDCEKVL